MFKCISIEETKQKIDSGVVYLADIRDPNAFDSGHMKGAKNINNQNAQEFIDQSDLSIPLVVICYHGHSSQPAAQYFATQGFSEVFSMDGGFEMWKLNNPVEYS